MFVVDLHTHTRFFHGFESRPTPFDPLGARLLGTMARRRGLDGLAVTNHDYCWYRFDARPVVIPGIEVSTTHGHLLIVGPDPPTPTARGRLSPGTAVDLAHERDCAAIVPHPFRNSTVHETGVDVDAVEVNGKNPENQARADELAESLNVPLVGGSDAHYPFEVGRAATRVDADVLGPESVVSAIREGNVRPIVHEDALDRVMKPIYRQIHHLKGHTQRR